MTAIKTHRYFLNKEFQIIHRITNVISLLGLNIIDCFDSSTRKKSHLLDLIIYLQKKTSVKRYFVIVFQTETLYLYSLCMVDPDKRWTNFSYT